MLGDFRKGWIYKEKETNKDATIKGRSSWIEKATNRKPTLGAEIKQET